MPRRHPALRTAFVAALLAAAAPALADDPSPAPAPGPEAKEPAAAAPKPAADPGAKIGAGERVRAKLRNQGSVEGVVTVSGVWERRDPAKGWVPAKHTEKGAGVRLWYVGDLDGFQFVAATEIVEMKSLGVFTEEDRKAVARRRGDLEKKAEEERKQIAADKAYVADATEKAKALLEEVEKERRQAEAEAAVAAKRKYDEEHAKRWAELLAKYPPEHWSLDTPKEIEHRKLILKVYPNDEELAFLKVYDEWREAVLALEAAKEMAKKAGR